MGVFEITSNDAWDSYVKPGTTVIVDFTAVWCGPCRQIGPVFEKLSNDPAYNGITFLKVDVDKCSDISQKCGIRAMPTFQVYVDGVQAGEALGGNLSTLKALLAKHAPQPAAV